MDDLCAHALQDAAHDVDGGVVSVKQTRGGDKAYFLRGLVTGEGLEFSGQVGDLYFRVGLSAVEVVRQPQGQSWPDVHQHHAQNHDQHIGHHARKNLVDCHMRWRDTLQVEG